MEKSVKEKICSGMTAKPWILKLSRILSYSKKGRTFQEQDKTETLDNIQENFLSELWDNSIKKLEEENK